MAKVDVQWLIVLVAEKRSKSLQRYLKTGSLELRATIVINVITASKLHLANE